MKLNGATLALATVGALAAAQVARQHGLFIPFPALVVLGSADRDLTAVQRLRGRAQRQGGERGSRGTRLEPLWFHGTSMEALDRIRAQGLRGRAVTGRANLAPLAGKVYVTSALGLALTHALGGLVEHRDGKWSIHSRRASGVLLVVDKPSACVPDEDWLGELLLSGAPAPVERALARVESLISSRVLQGWAGIPRHRRDDYAVWARTGKTAINLLTKTPRGREALEAIAAFSPSLACEEDGVRVVSAWEITPDVIPLLKPDGSNVQEVCRRLEVGRLDS